MQDRILLHIQTISTIYLISTPTNALT